MAALSEVEQREIGDGVKMFTLEGKVEKHNFYEYWIESTSFKVVDFTFSFAGSENFAVVEPASAAGSMEVKIQAPAFGQSVHVKVQQQDIYKGASLSLGMSWLRSEPDEATIAALLAEKEAKLNTLLEQAAGVFAPAELHGKSLEEIENVCRKAQMPFFDLTFPPSARSLFACESTAAGSAPAPASAASGGGIWSFFGGGGGGGGEQQVSSFALASEASTASNNKIEWRRPSQFAKEGEKYQLFEGNIEPQDIKQGALGDCWFMCALSSIAEFQELVKNLFVPRGDGAGYSTDGVYQVRLCKNGEWQVITVDDLFPCKPQGGPIYSHANGAELWVMLLEKVFAKVHGSYHQIKGGQPFEAMMDLTGAPYKDIRFNDDEVHEDIASGKLFDYLLECDENSYIMSLCTSGKDNFTESGHHPADSIGLVPGHAYTLLECKVTNADKHKLCKIRNPWGSFEWSGDWGDASPLWTEELKAECNMEVADDGIFWMSFEDVCIYFTGVSVAMVRHEGLNAHPWHEFRIKAQYSFSPTAQLTNVPMYEMVLSKQCEVFVSVHQKDKRCIGAPTYLDVGVTLLKKEADGKLTFAASSGNSAERQNQLDVKSLDAGTYIIIPTSSGIKMGQQIAKLKADGVEPQGIALQREVVVAIHCCSPLTVREVAYDEATMELAMELPAVKMGTKKDLFGDGSFFLYTLKGGYCGVTFVGENHETDAILLTMDFTGSENIVSSKGLVAETVILPGSYEVCAHIGPLDADHGFSYHISYKCRGATAEEIAASTAH